MDELHKKGAANTAKRAVLYARVSSDDRSNDGRNLDGQIEMCREHALERGWRVVEELAEDDRGASGASFELEQLDRVREMARAGEFDVLVVREIDRLSRNLAKQLIVEEELKRAGVQIVYALAEYPDTPEGRLNKHIRATIAEYEREKIVERMTRGRRNKVKAGHVLMHGRAPYGYRLGDVGGKAMLVIDGNEARVVRMIFQWYTEGDGEDGPLSISGIARKLGEMEIPTFADTDPRNRGGEKKRGRGQWSRASVNKILKSETYAGVWWYGKFNNNQGKRNPRDQLLSVEVPAIVAREVWEEAKARMDENRKRSWSNRKNQYLLSGRVACGTCGCKMLGEGQQRNKLYLYYRCPATYRRLEYARDCNAPGFRADHVDAAIWDWVKSFLTDPAALAAGLREYQAECDRENAVLRDRLQVVEDLLADNRQQLERLLDLYLSGGFTRDILTERKSRLEKTVAVLEGERVNLNAHLETQTITEEQVQSLQDFATEVAKGLEAAEKEFETRRQLVEMLDVQVTLAVEDNQKVIHARCLLGASQLQAVHTTPHTWCVDSGCTAQCSAGRR